MFKRQKKKMIKFGRQTFESRHVRWLIVVMGMGAVILYIASGYTGFMFAEQETRLRPTVVNIEETIRAIEVIERNIKVSGTIERNVLNHNPNELFIKHDANGGWADFVFTTKTTLSIEQRIKMSSLTTRDNSILKALTTKSGFATSNSPITTSNSPGTTSNSRGTTSNSPGITSSTTPIPGVQAPVQINQNQVPDSAVQPQLQSNVVPNQQGINTNTNTLLSPQQTYIKPSVEIIPRVRVTEANCAKLFDNDGDEHKRAQQYQKDNLKVPIPDEEYSKLTQDCDKFKRERQYILQPLSQEEAEFPIAFSLVVFKDVEQIERLLRAIYRPQNYYCIHIDVKANQKVRDAMTNLANCFENVFMSSRSIDVQWGWFSVLEPELVCMQDLLKYKKWKYFINLTGQEWPLKTNEDLVKILKVFNGANSMEGTVKRRNVERTQFVHNGYWATDKRKDTPPPKAINLSKGSIHITVSRAFVEYLLNDPLAKEFTEWLKDTGVPDETLFSSLNHSPHLGVPGAYKGEPETHPIKYPFIARFKNWGTYPFDYPCKGQRVRMVCIWSTRDLPQLRTRPELFTNKFYLDYEPLALDCMEELHYNRTREELVGTRQFSTLFYQQLDFVKNHV